MATAHADARHRKHTRQQIQDEFDRLKARVNISGWGSGVTVSVETTRENLPAVLRLWPRSCASRPSTRRSSSSCAPNGSRASSSSAASRARSRSPRSSSMLKPYPKGDIRYVDSIDEGVADIKAVTREQMRSFHRDFYGAQPAQFAVVGDFDAAELEAQVTQAVRQLEGAEAVHARAQRVPRRRRSRNAASRRPTRRTPSTSPAST